MSTELLRRTADPAAAEMLELAEASQLVTAWDRYKAQQPGCKFGNTGVCCRICLQGPCRIIPSKKNADKGICGADVYTVVARNIVRYMAAGASAHSDHGREIAYTLKGALEGHAPDYKVTDEKKVITVATKVGIATEGRAINDIALDIANLALADFGKPDDKPCTWLKTGVSEERMKKFTDTGIFPTAIDRAVVSLLHQTHMGTDADPVNIIFGGLKSALADFTGMHLATDITDILFGTPTPIVTEANLGVLKKNSINIAVHGHNPLLSQMVVFASREADAIAAAKAAGADGFNLVGICCTGNEVLMREGVPTVTNFASQELAVMTGAVDLMTMDVQCIMPGVIDMCNCFGTKLVSTSKISKIPGSVHIDFNEATAMKDARKIIKMAIAQFEARKGKDVHIPDIKKQVVGGFSFEAMMELFGKVNPQEPMKVIADAIMSGEIKGVAAFAGCNNQKTIHDGNDLLVAKEMAKNDVFILATGCSAGAFAKAGLLSSEGIEKYAGPGLKKLMKRLQDNCNLNADLPLIFHMGSCVDNSRLVAFWEELARVMGVSVPQIPFVAAAPEAMSEKAVSIGSWVITMGIPCYVGVMPPVTGSELIYGICTQIARDVFGGYFILTDDPQEGANEMLRRLDNRRWKLQVNKKAMEKYSSKQPILFEGQ